MVLRLRIHNEVICRSCGNVFCCAKCRLKHEQNAHTTVIHQPIKTSFISDKLTNTSNQFREIYLFCEICEERPLRLINDMHSFLVQHVAETHLPLQCQKCSKLYETIDDLRNFNECYHNANALACNLPQSVCTNYATEMTILKTETQTISTQTSPWTKSKYNTTNETSFPQTNIHWKHSKVTHGCSGDSVSSLRNTSLMSNGSIKPNSYSYCQSHLVSSAVMSKVIRSTSTPVQLSMIVAKPNMPSFDASGNCQVSSIHNSECDTEGSQANFYSTGIGNNNKALEIVNDGRKILIGRTKVNSITPLRRVMSKSIQKALMQHGIVTTSFLVPHNCKNKSDSIISSDVESNHTHAEALDLRLSPALRRSNSDGGCEKTARKSIYTPYNMRRRVLMSAHKLTTTASIVITHTEKMSRPAIGSESSYLSNQSFLTNSNYQSAASSNDEGSVYKTCSSVKIIRTTTELSGFNIQQDNCGDDVSEFNKNCIEKIIPCNNMLVSMTPIARLPGVAINKKFIKFETPTVEKTPAKEIYKTQNSPQEIYYTPTTLPEDKDTIMPASCKTVPRNLVKRFSIDSKSPFSKRCAQDAAFGRNMDHTCNLDDDILCEDNKSKSIQNDPTANKQKIVRLGHEFSDQQRQFQFEEHRVGIWSKMTSIFRLPTFNDTMQKTSNESSEFNCRRSTSIIKRCASIAGSLVRMKVPDHDGQLQSLKRKRTHSTDNQYISTFLTQLNGYGGASPPLDATSKRLRIQGRRPIRQTSVKKNKKI